MASRVAVHDPTEVVSKSAVRTSTRKWALLITLCVIACAGTARLLTYDRYLPFVDNTDQAVYVALADEIRGFSDQSALRDVYGLLAPLYVYLNAGVQTVFDALKTYPWHLPGEYFYAMASVSAFLGVCTALTIAWIGWQLAGVGAALLGGLIWSLSPIVVSLNSLAIPDPLLYLLCALAVGTALAAWRKRSLWWLALSLLAAVAAIYTKLWLVTVTLPFLIVSIALVRQNRKMLRGVLLLYILAGLFTAHFLIVLDPFHSTVKVSANLVEGSFLANLFSVSRILNNLWFMVYPIDNGLGLLSFGGFVVGGVAALYCQRKRLRMIDSFSLLIVVIYSLSTLWLSAGISHVNIDGAGRMRHVLPISAVVIALWSAGLILAVRAIWHWLTDRHFNVAWLVPAGVGLMLLEITVGFVPQDAALIAQFSHAHVANQLVTWFDGSPPHDGLVLLPSNSLYNALWNRIWGGYNGSKPYDWWYTPIDTIPDSPPSAYIDRNIRWLLVSDSDFTRSNDPHRVRDYLKQLLLVKTIPAVSGQVEGETAYIYRFAPPQYRARSDFGGQFRLVGYDLTATTVQPGQTIQFRPYWQLEQPTTQNFSMFLHLYSADALAAGTPTILTQWDGDPLPNQNRPTSLWSDTQEIYFGDPFYWTIPADLAAGNYVIALGLYDVASQQRLSGANGITFYTIPLTVTGIS